MVTTNRMCSTDGHIPILDDIYSESSTQKAPLGTRMAWADGRIYRYFQNGGSAQAAGKLMQQPTLLVGWDNAIKPAAAYGIGATQIGCSASIGTTVVDTNIEVTACVDGFFGVRSGVGFGNQYQIKDHTAISSNSAFTMNLYDPLLTALVATASCCLTRNPYKDLIVSPASPTGAIIGVATIIHTADYFGWCQTWGIGLGMVDATYPVVAGVALQRSIATAGYVSALSSVATMHGVVGEAVYGGGADILAPVIWKISP